MLGLVAGLSPAVGLPIREAPLVGEELHILDVRQLVGAASEGLDDTVGEGQG